jgi:hypothetical protein
LSQLVAGKWKLVVDKLVASLIKQRFASGTTICPLELKRLPQALLCSFLLL